MTIRKTESVTGWSARKRHLAREGSKYMLCSQGIPVRPGGMYAGHSNGAMTQERIDAMDLCKICARIAAVNEAEDRGVVPEVMQEAQA